MSDPTEEGQETVRSRKPRLADKPTKAQRQPVESRKPHPDAWKRALKLAGGDARRLTTNRDGSVTVHNNPQR